MDVTVSALGSFTLLERFLVCDRLSANVILFNEVRVKGLFNCFMLFDILLLLFDIYIIIIIKNYIYIYMCEKETLKEGKRKNNITKKNSVTQIKFNKIFILK